jgi:hypothetical protein
VAGQGFDGLSYHVSQVAHSRECKSDRRVSAQCYGLCRDGSKGRRSGGVPGFDGLSYHAAQAAHSRRCKPSPHNVTECVATVHQ